jgi:hypothetical protein
MIINENKQDVTVNGSFKTSGFKIQASSKAFDILSSNIYQNKVRAVVREISCNAVDAHTAANNPNPIKVHLPTALEPHFSVRDFGIGLSDEDVREIFTTYFCSTKTSSNDFVGALGLGSKSPFCLVDSFTVTSFYNGAKMLYSCYRDEHGEPQVALLTTEDTDEFNGLEVSMAIEDRHIDQFAQEAEHVYFYFDTIPNINKIHVADSIIDRKNKIKVETDDVVVERWGGWSSVSAVMGGVAYEIPSSINVPNVTGHLKFNMGEISFDAGRESLSLDDKTIDAIKAKCEKVKGTLKDAALATINSEPTAYLRAKKAEEMSNCPGVTTSDLTKFDLPRTSTPMEYYYSRGGSWQRSKTVDRSETHSLPFSKVEYFRHKPRFGTRIKEYLKGTGKSIVLLTDEQIKETNIDVSLLQDLDTLPKVERTTSSGRSYQTANSVLVFNGRESWQDKNNWDEADDLPTTEKVYVKISRYNPEDATMSQIRLAHGLGITVYGVKNAHVKTKAFKTGNWTSLEDYMERCYKSIVEDTVFDSDLAEYDHRNIRDELVAMRKDGHAINCDAVQAFFDKNDSLGMVKNQNLRRVAEAFRWTVKWDDSLKKDMEAMLAKHPMLEFFELSYGKDHKKGRKVLADYLNRA